jgi:type IV pilus assembly protein PilY1
MKSNLKTKLTQAAALVGSALGAVALSHAQQLNIATDPLGTGTTSIKPNVMFILDDSGSMGRDNMPDYITDSNNLPSSNTDTTFSTAACYDAGDDGGGITATTDPCVFGDPPYNSSDFNTIYYNPDIRYRPGMNYDGTEMENQDATNTTSFTAVLVNPYQSTTRTNLAASYQDRVWCLSQSDAATSGNCRQNAGYQFPDWEFQYGETTGGAVKYVTGSPYYYRIKTAQYCNSAARTSCRSGSAVNPATDVFAAAEFCTDPELTNCAAGANVTVDHIYSGVRWCADTGTLLDCQRKKIRVETAPGSGVWKHYIYPKHLGTIVTGNAAALKADGNIQITSVNAAGGQITGITVGGTSVISAAITVPASSTPTQVASLIVAAWTNASYVPTVSGANVNVQAAAAGTAPNGQTISVAASAIGTSSAKGRIVITNAGGSNTITSIQVNGQQLLSCSPGATQTFTVGVRVAYWEAGGGTSGALSRIRADSGTSSNDRKTAVRNALRTAINTCAAVPTPQPGGATVPWTAANDTSADTFTLFIVAPSNLGSTPNSPTNWVVAKAGGIGTTTCNMGQTSCSGVVGTSTSTVATSNSQLSGGRAAVTAKPLHVGYGQFARTDIVPANDSYSKSVLRSDCAAATCTYLEEMNNFSNWYSYYRTRILMMKTAVGRAFNQVNDSYRVGFITINPSPISSKYLKISDFTPGATGHKQAWYSKLYSQNTGPSTPLREALSRVGWIFSGKLNTGLTSGIPVADDPVTASCQPNFAILSTDGYWNGNGGQLLDGTAMTNQDGTNTAPYSMQSQGVYDGGTGATGTLADVALYYYSTDLRPTLTNTVPTTNKDVNNTQHMVTFTLGLGLDGELSYQPDYETAGSGDFFDIKQGTRKWTVPVADQPTALDDLWHAAVNGRGVFFSAKDPETLTSSLSETLDQLQARVGAGAAAATSNLQPVAGDNFAFTAQYQTSDWIGDLKARTIDLSSGIVATATLWSAATILDGREHIDRRIFLRDGTDAAGNRMKHFCMPADVGNVWCNDGAGLTGAEQAYFDPAGIALTQEGQWTTAGTTQTLVNYLRGDTLNYNTGSSPRGANDLFRSRSSTMGDIVNAQPAYVRKSPFQYSDAGYSGFRSCTEGTGASCAAAQFPDPSKPRRGTVYAAVNSGMLQAFETDVNNNAYYQTAGITTSATTDDTFTGNNAGNGVERWAYIPTMVLPELYVLANEPYTHRYFVDGTPTVGDICVSPCATQDDWRSILVAGLNSGGRGYYALDITNPLAPKALWEFTYTSSCVSVAAGTPVGGPFTGDCNVGLTYGNPIITKRSFDGKWVVIVTSGYNNGSADGTGDGGGYLYVLDAANGQILHRLATGAGTAGVPSGLAKINAWSTNSAVDNTALAVYGGDLGGNLWRFDLTYQGGLNVNYLSVTKVAHVKDSSGTAQPITVKPELGEYANKRIILFGTGQFLEAADKSTTGQQTIYALRDEPAVVGVAGVGCDAAVVCNVRGATVKMRQFAAGSVTDTRTVNPSDPAPNWATDYGWRIDLPDSGERVNVDPQLQLGTLVIASNVPSSDTCTAGGSSFINFLDYATGSFVPGAAGNAASVKIGASLTVGLNVVMLPGGKVVSIVTTADNQQLTKDTPVPPSAFTGRRVSWRELVRDQ